MRGVLLPLYQVRGDGQTEYTYTKSQYHHLFERAPKHQRSTEHDGALCARACGGAVVQAFAPGEQREEAEELWLDGQRHVQAVDAQWERCDAPEESSWEGVGCVCQRCVFGGKVQVHASARRRKGWGS